MQMLYLTYFTLLNRPLPSPASLSPCFTLSHCPLMSPKFYIKHIKPPPIGKCNIRKSVKWAFEFLILNQLNMCDVRHAWHIEYD